MAGPHATGPQWQVSLDTVEPGWVFVPGALTVQQRGQWRDETLADVGSLWGDDWEEESAEQAKRLVDEALEVREISDAVFIFQVWFSFAPVATMCRIFVTYSEGAPDWVDLPGRTYGVDAPNVGPGLQYSTRQSHRDEDGTSRELRSTVFLFDDGETTLLIATDETDPLLLTRMQYGLAGIVESIRMQDSDGVQFKSVQPKSLLDDDKWQLERQQ